MLHDFDGLVVVSGLVIELRGFRRTPAAAIGRSGRGSLQFTHGKIDQAAVAQKLRFLHVQLIPRRFRSRYFAGAVERRHTIEQGICGRGIACRGREMLHPLASQFGVIEVAIAIRELLIKGAGHEGLVIFLGQTSAPI